MVLIKKVLLLLTDTKLSGCVFYILIYLLVFVTVFLSLILTFLFFKFDFY